MSLILLTTWLPERCCAPYCIFLWNTKNVESAVGPHFLRFSWCQHSTLFSVVQLIHLLSHRHILLQTTQNKFTAHTLCETFHDTTYVCYDCLCVNFQATGRFRLSWYLICNGWAVEPRALCSWDNWTMKQSQWRKFAMSMRRTSFISGNSPIQTSSSSSRLFPQLSYLAFILLICGIRETINIQKYSWNTNGFTLFFGFAWKIISFTLQFELS